VSWASTYPAAQAALLALCQAGIDLDGEVRDGPQVTNSAALEVIVIGYVTTADDTAADGSFGTGDMGQASVEETFTIHNALGVLSGSADPEAIAAGRARVFELHADVGALLAANRGLGGVVMQAEMGPWTLREDTESGGYRAELRFSVDCRAFTQR